MNARTADFAATAPWKGITGKPTTFPSSPDQLGPAAARNNDVLVWSASRQQWVPITTQQLVALLHLTAESVGLGNVDNTSDAQKNAAVATLTNKTIVEAIIELTRYLSLKTTGLSGLGLILATDSNFSADRVLTLRLSDENRVLDLEADLLTRGAGPITISGNNGASRLIDLEADLIVLTDGTADAESLTFHLGGASREISLGGDLTIFGNVTLTGNGYVLTLNGDVSFGGSLTTVGSGPAFFTFTALTLVTFPTSGTLANEDYVDAGDAATLAAANSYTDTGVATRQPLTGNSFAVAGLPAANANVGRVVYCTNGSAGSPCAAISDGTNWKVIALGATVSP